METCLPHSTSDMLVTHSCTRINERKCISMCCRISRSTCGVMDCLVAGAGLTPQRRMTESDWHKTDTGTYTGPTRDRTRTDVGPIQRWQMTDSGPTRDGRRAVAELRQVDSGVMQKRHGTLLPHAHSLSTHNRTRTHSRPTRNQLMADPEPSQCRRMSDAYSTYARISAS